MDYGLGLGQASAGALVRVPLFQFSVPALEPGPYMTYFTCLGSSNGWSGLFEASSLRVNPMTPAVTMPPTATESTATPATDVPFAASTLLIGLVSVAVVLQIVRHRSLARSR